MAEGQAPKLIPVDLADGAYPGRTMPGMTPEQRSMRSRIAGYAAAARHDGREMTALARQTYRDSFSSGHACALCPRIDIPPGLPEAEVQRRVRALRAAHFGRLSLKSSIARAKRRKAAPVSERSGTAMSMGGTDDAAAST